MGSSRSPPVRLLSALYAFWEWYESMMGDYSPAKGFENYESCKPWFLQSPLVWGLSTRIWDFFLFMWASVNLK